MACLELFSEHGRFLEGVEWDIKNIRTCIISLKIEIQSFFIIIIVIEILSFLSSRHPDKKDAQRRPSDVKRYCK